MVYLPKKMVLSRCLLLSSVSKLAPKVYNLQVISSELCENEIKSRRKINVNRRVEIISAVKA